MNLLLWQLSLLSFVGAHTNVIYLLHARQHLQQRCLVYEESAGESEIIPIRLVSNSLHASGKTDRARMK